MSKPLWTSQEAAGATGGRAVGDWVVSGLSIDTRSLQPGDLFVPLRDVRDGHDFIPDAREAGAGAILSEHQDELEPALIVEDALEAMRRLAVGARDRSRAIRFGVTGSVGKTSLKEAIATICEHAGETHKSLKSFNNHWGVPLTLATLPRDAVYGVFEMGMNHAGELANLSPLVRPDIAIITKIAPAHLAFFENVEAIAAAKAEIFQGLSKDGWAVLNADDVYFEFLSHTAKEAGAKIISFGKAYDADVRFEAPTATSSGVKATVHVKGKAYDMHVPQFGEHWIANGACAVAATTVAGIDPKQAMSALSTFGALAGRGELLNLSSDTVTYTLIDDSYNANPESMRAAIAALGTKAHGRKIAVLGDMFELGADELSLHAALAEPLQAVGVSRVIVVGECMRALRGALPRPLRAAWAKDWVAALDALETEVQSGDTVLVKGSNASGLGKLVAALKEKQKQEVPHAL